MGTNERCLEAEAQGGESNGGRKFNVEGNMGAKSNYNQSGFKMSLLLDHLGYPNRMLFSKYFKQLQEAEGSAFSPSVLLTAPCISVGCRLQAPKIYAHTSLEFIKKNASKLWTRSVRTAGTRRSLGC